MQTIKEALVELPPVFFRHGQLQQEPEYLANMQVVVVGFTPQTPGLSAVAVVAQPLALLEHLPSAMQRPTLALAQAV